MQLWIWIERVNWSIAYTCRSARFGGKKYFRARYTIRRIISSTTIKVAYPIEHRVIFGTLNDFSDKVEYKEVICKEDHKCAFRIYSFELSSLAYYHQHYNSLYLFTQVFITSKLYFKWWKVRLREDTLSDGANTVPTVYLYLTC